jgi:hypothetical protein
VRNTSIKNVEFVLIANAVDTYFLYLNLILKAFVDDGNDVMLEEHILAAMSFQGGVSGTSGVLLNCDKLTRLALNKKFKISRIGSRATHKIRRLKDKAEVHESSTITYPEVILAAKLRKHQKNKLAVVVADTFVSDKAPLFVQSIENAAQLMTTQARLIDQALLTSGIVQSISSGSIDAVLVLVATPQRVTLKRAAYPGNNPNKLSSECLEKLKELYDIGKTNKKKKVGAERAHQILVDALIFNKWDQQLDLTVPKIKAFFQMTPAKMNDAIQMSVLAAEDVEEASRCVIDIEREATALSMMDIDA